MNQQLVRNVAGDVALHRVMSERSNRSASQFAFRDSQLRWIPFFAMLRNAAHQLRNQMELFADRRRVLLICFETENRAARNHFHIGKL